MSIRLRLTLWYSGLLAMALLAFGVLIYSLIYNNTTNRVKSELHKVAESVNYRPSLSLQYGININPVTPQGLNANIYGIQFVNYAKDRNGRSIEQSSNLASANITFPVPAYEAAQHNRVVKFHTRGAPFLILEKKVELNGAFVGLLQVGAFVGREESFLTMLRTILWSCSAVSLLVAFIVGMFLSKKALSPIGRITEAAEQIQSGSELGLRIPREKPNDEIGRLTDTLNGMLSRIERAYKYLEETNAAQRRFVSDASHELRTPLTTIRGNVDLLSKIWTEEEGGAAEEAQQSAVTPAQRKEMAQEAVRDIADEARRMSGLVNNLLSLARADAGYQVDMEPLQLKQLVEEAARRASFLPRNAEWNVGPLHELEGVWVQGNRDYLLQLLFILIENGFKYTPQGEVRLFAVRSGERIGLAVADTGIGIHAEDIAHVFDRFFRADRSRGETAGTGLGLSIAKWIADIHRGVLEVKSLPGKGSIFTLWLPIAL